MDKTDLVYKLAAEGRVYFLSRPRRFGKSLLLSTLRYYFLGRRDLFKGLAIEQLETEWVEYPVFHFSFGTSNYNQPGTLDVVINKQLSDFEKIYGKDPQLQDFGLRLKDLVKAAHEKTGHRAVVLIDEYDKPILDALEQDYHVTDSMGNRMGLEDYNRNVLKGFYGVFKDADEDL